MAPIFSVKIFRGDFFPPIFISKKNRGDWVNRRKAVPIPATWKKRLWDSEWCSCAGILFCGTSPLCWSCPPEGQTPRRQWQYWWSWNVDPLYFSLCPDTDYFPPACFPENSSIGHLYLLTFSDSKFLENFWNRSAGMVMIVCYLVKDSSIKTNSIESVYV